MTEHGNQELAVMLARMRILATAQCRCMVAEGRHTQQIAIDVRSCLVNIVDTLPSASFLPVGYHQYIHGQIFQISQLSIILRLMSFPFWMRKRQTV